MGQNKPALPRFRKGATRMVYAQTLGSVNGTKPVYVLPDHVPDSRSLLAEVTSKSIKYRLCPSRKNKKYGPELSSTNSHSCECKLFPTETLG